MANYHCSLVPWLLLLFFSILLVV
uniref:Uncharacterized protein n=1 Tax=Arundo donax TaxID=35708 RepID=A0A0A9B815_ARUDO